MRNFLRLALLASALLGCARQAYERIDTSGGSRDSELLQAPAADTVTVCVLRNENGQLAQARYDPVSQDTLIEGEPSAQIYPRIPPPYPDSAEWFLNREPMVFRGRTLVLRGTPVAALPHEVKPIGTYRGIALFSEFPEAQEQNTLYLPVAPGCEFQPYLDFSDYGPPRGGV